MFVRRPLAKVNSCMLQWKRRAITFLAGIVILAGGEFPRAARTEEARDDLVLEYRFEGSAADSSGNERDGTPHGLPQFVPGKVGQCVQLDGQQDYIDSGNTLADLGQTFTIECWANPGESQNNYVRYRPAMVVESRRIAGSAEEFSSVVGGTSQVAAATVPEKPLEISPQAELTRVVSLDGDGWLIAADPKNEGRQENWSTHPAGDAKPTKVPWPIQDVYPDYHDVAWYWRDFTASAPAFPDARCLLRFHAVEYLAEVWVNGVRVGSHERGETPFVLDATGVFKPGLVNTLAVRVLNPTYEPIDGIALKQTASGAKQYPVATNSAYNCGGILASVELLLAPAVRIEHLHAITDWKTGEKHAGCP